MAGGWVTRNPSEAQLHRAVADYLRLTLPPFVCFTTIGHGGGGKARGGQLKAKGMTAGVADVLIVHQGRALFIELKTSRGKQSPEQKSFQLWAETAGAKYAICRSIECVESTLVDWSVTLRPVSLATRKRAA